MKKTRYGFLVLMIGSLVFLAACDVSETPTSAIESDIEEPLLKAGDPIPGQYIVVLKDKTEFAGKTVREALDEMTSAQGVETLHKYESALLGFAGTFSDEALERVHSNPFVDYVEQDRIVTLPPISLDGVCDRKPDHPKCGDGGGGEEPPSGETIPYGIGRVGGGATYTGSNKAWVIDTGIDLDHPDLNVDMGNSESFLSGRQKNNPEDQHGHGTHVAGTIAAIDNSRDVVGVAAGATVVSVRVLDRRGSGSNSGVIAGVNYVAASATNGDVANMSLGGGVSTALDSAVKSAAASGVKFSLAAGNESDHANNHSPARANGNNIYTISAVDADDDFAWFSNYGNPPVDYAAPGVSILSLWKNGGTNTINGTSMAAPHVAGLLLSGSVKADGSANNPPDGGDYPIAHR